jgi:pyruvate formate lyase activating enzyme
MSRAYLNVKGRIFNIQKFSIHDGPGIRTIVFLKGCVLRCRWCCNPESQNYEIETIQTNGKTKTVGRDVTVEQVLLEIEKDRAYYRRSGGGVTLSGGEALCQPEFGAALLYGLKENGFHTAMESTGCAPFETITRYLDNLDLFLMDIKHMDQTKHKQYTGCSNELMQDNARLIAKSDTKLVIRVPVVPGFNDTLPEITAIAKFAASLPGVDCLHLLPYHRLGEDKYLGLGRDYQMKGVLPPTMEQMALLLLAVEQQGLKGIIGGS